VTERFRADLLDLVGGMEPPMTIRQIYYQASVAGLVDKTEEGYNKVQGMLREFRLNGLVPWDAISDNTRCMRKPSTFSSPADAMRRWAVSYRKALWDSADAQVEVWIEKDALAGVVVDVTSEFDVPLMVARGYASLTPAARMRRGTLRRSCTSSRPMPRSTLCSSPSRQNR